MLRFVPKNIFCNEEEDNACTGEKKKQKTGEVPSGPELGEQGIHFFLESFRLLHEAVGLLLDEGDVGGMEERAELGFGAEKDLAFLLGNEGRAG